MKHKILLEAPLVLRRLKPAQAKAMASKLSLPENDQADLLFMSAILVSTGTNKNGATFIGSELIKARDSISQKAVNLEHKEQEIIGHIASAMYMDWSGNVIDDEDLYKELSNSENASEVAKTLDDMSMDIGIVSVIYKDRFPDLAAEIEKGEWKVSMECYYEDYDLKIGSVVIPKQLVAKKLVKLSKAEETDLSLVLSGKSIGTSQVSRVLKDIRFCGVGIVKNPANERSIIVEAASMNLEKTMESLDQATASVTENPEGFTQIPNPIKNEVVQIEAAGYYLLEVSESGESKLVDGVFDSNYNTVSKEAIKLSAQNKSSKFLIVAANSIFTPKSITPINQSSDAVLYSTDDKGDVLEVHSFGLANKEKSFLAAKYGPAEQSAGICISFEKYVTQYPNNPNPGRIVATHWCKLFNKSCPVLGADAHDSSCLRNKYSRLVKDDNLHGNAIRPAPYNPRVDLRDTELLSSDELPSTDTEQQILNNKPSVDSQPLPSKIKQGPAANKIKDDLNTPGVLITDSEFIPQGVLFKSKKGLVITDPAKQFPIQVASISFEARKSLSNKDFGLPESRKFPIHSKESVASTMQMFVGATKTLKIKEQKELYKNILLASDSLGVSTEDFEKQGKSLGFSIKPGLEFSEDYGIPRLKQFPLNSKEQVLAAMSRYSFLKSEITDHEKAHLIASILRAAGKFHIDTSSFRTKARPSN